MKHIWKKCAAFLAMTAACVSLAAPVSAAEGWQRDGDSWRYQESGGEYAAGQWKLVHDHWYYFDGDGRMATGWRLVDGRWRYFNPETGETLPQGAMVTGMLQLEDGLYYFDEWGGMCTDELVLGAEAYGFDENGRFSYLRPADLKNLSFTHPGGWVSFWSEDLLMMLPNEEGMQDANILAVYLPFQGEAVPLDQESLETSLRALFSFFNDGEDPLFTIFPVSPVQGTQAQEALQVTVQTTLPDQPEIISTLWLLSFDEGWAEICYTASEEAFPIFYRDALSMARSLDVIH